MKGRPQGWSWARDAAPLLPPTLDPDTALALTLLAHLSASALPPRTLTHLTPYLAQAERILDLVFHGILTDQERRRRAVLSPGGASQ